MLPFWDRFGIDHERGGFWCNLDYDGARIDESKHRWFQGRGLWVYSYLYRHFGRDPRHLEVARKAKDYVLGYLNREEDLYARYFAAEGLVAYAAASGDDEARAESKRVIAALFRRLRDPAVVERPQGVWMMTLGIATQWLRRWDDSEILAMADDALDAIVSRHYNPAIGLNNEILRYDYTRPKSEGMQCVLGHSIECLWMALDEARRRGDRALADLCCERLRCHLDVGWDQVYGGLADAVTVDAGRHWWPLAKLFDTGVEFRNGRRYRFRYRKHYWAINEVLVAAVKAWEHARAPWAQQYFALAQHVADDKFSLARRGLGSHMIASDRKMTWQPRSVRQDNYHPLRRLMLVLEALDRLIALDPAPS